MKKTSLTFKLIKVGSLAVSVAVFGMGMTVASAVPSTVNLGTAIGGLSGSVIYNNSVQSYNYGLSLGSASATINNTNYNSTTYLTGSIRDSNTTANNFAALGVSGGEGSGSDNFVLGSGSVVSSVTTGSAATRQYTPTTYYYNEVMNQYVRDMVFALGIEADYSSDERQDGYTTGPIGFSTNTDLGLTNTYGFVSTYSCNIALIPYTCVNAAGSSSYTSLTATDGQVVEDNTVAGSGYKVQTVGKATFTDTFVSHDWTGSIGSASTSTDYAVGTTGSLTMNGNNSINGAARVGGGIYINGSANSLNGDVTGSITFQTGGSVTISGGSDVAGNINFNGQNATLTLSNGSDVTGNIDTSLTRTGTLIFENNSVVTGSIGATSAIKQIEANGTGVVKITGATKANEVDLFAAGTVAFGGGLDTRLADNTLGSVNFNNYNGTVQIGNGSSLFGNVINIADNLGILTFISGTQSMNGQIGTDSTKKINTLNIGGVNSGLGFDVSGDVYSTTTVNGDVFATNTVLNNSSVAISELILATGKNITGTSVTTADANKGILTLQGGDQTVTASVGTNGAWLNTVNSGANSANSTITGAVYSVNVTNTGSGTSNFNGNVTATNINVDAGTSYFKQSVNATTTTIGTGTGHFNTVGGTTTSTNLNFTGGGTANLNQGMTFTSIAYAGNNATVNVAAGEDLVGTTISTTTDKTGYLNMLGGTQSVNATVGAASHSLNKVTAGEDSATTNFTNSAAMYAKTLEVSGNGSVSLSGGLVGNLSYVNNVSSENGTVTIASGKDLIGNVTTGASGYSQGVLTMSGGTQQVSGTIGSDGAPLTTVNAGANGATTTLNGMTFADTLQFTGNGTVVLNGTNSADPVKGLKGTVDFGTNNTNTGTLEIGDGVNLTTGANGINFKDANNATLTFNGSSTVTGNIGSSGNDNNVFKTINSGVTGKNVTFLGDVYVSESTFHVTGNGVVNLGGDLYGPLTFDSPSDGSVNVANGKSIIVGSGPEITSYGSFNAGKGTINFVGSTTLTGDIGTTGTGYVAAANFHNTTSDSINSPLYVGSVTQTLNKNIYATTTTIGNNLANAPTVGDVTSNVFLGNALTLSAGTIASTSTTTLNTAGSVDASSGSVVFDHSKNTDGTLNNVAVVTQSTTGQGIITTNGGTLNFAVATQGYDSVLGGGKVSSDVTKSSKITGDINSSLAMNNSEKVNLSLLGSLKNAQSYTLINVASGTTGSQLATLTDNSYVIDTFLTRNNGDLIVNTSRDENTYVTKSDTSGHFSNNAAITLGALGAAGTGYSADMQVVFNQLDLDQWGYGDNQANLATQAKRLAPISNGSLVRSAVFANTLALDVARSRLSYLRGDTALARNDLSSGISAGDKGYESGFWLKAIGATAKQDQRNMYDGYKANVGGMALGLDKKVTEDLILGVGLSAATSSVNQDDFRDGDKTRINNYQGMLYGSYHLTKELFLDGSLYYAKNDYKGDRLTAVGRTAKSNFDGSQYGGRLGLGYKIDLGNQTSFIPMATVEYSRLKQDEYTETNAGSIGLNVESQNFDRTRYGLGGRLTSVFKSGEALIIPEIDLNWYHDSGKINKDVVASYIGGGSSFVTPSLNKIDRDYLNLGLGVNLQANEIASIQIRYDLDAAANFMAHTGAVTGRINF